MARNPFKFGQKFALPSLEGFLPLVEMTSKGNVLLPVLFIKHQETRSIPSDQPLSHFFCYNIILFAPAAGAKAKILFKRGTKLLSSNLSGSSIKWIITAGCILLIILSLSGRVIAGHVSPGSVQSIAGGNNYYVCGCASDADGDCQAGNDSGAGTLNDPWETYAQARQTFSSLSAGDSILFCEGGAWELTDNDTRWVNYNCEADNRCLVGSYTPTWASGDEARPIMTQTTTGDLFRLEDGGNAEHEEGYIIENLDLRSLTHSSNGILLYNDIDDVEIRNVNIQGFDLGVHLAGSNACSADPACDGKNERITLRDSTILNNFSQGWLGASSGSQIINNYFEGNGDANIFDHNIYVSGSSGGQTQGIRIIGNQLYQSSRGSTSSCAGVSLVVHGEHNDLIIEGNEIWEDVGAANGGCWGIAVDNGYGGEAEGFTNVIIRNNVVRNVGNLSIGVGACANCVIENNLIINEQSYGVTAIAAPNRALLAGDLPQDNITIRNNSIWLNADGGRGILVNDLGDNHVVVSNAIYYAGTSDNFDCFSVNLSPTAFDAFDYNLCYYPNASGADWSSQDSVLSDWQTNTDFDLNSWNADPGFTNPATGDFTAASGSAPIVDNGHPTLSSVQEINGGFRTPPSDIGAHEWTVLVFSDYIYLPAILR